MIKGSDTKNETIVNKIKQNSIEDLLYNHGVGKIILSKSKNHKEKMDTRCRSKYFCR